MKKILLKSTIGSLCILLCLGCETSGGIVGTIVGTETGTETGTTETGTDTDSSGGIDTETGIDTHSETSTIDDGDGGYTGSGRLLSVSDAILSSCDVEEQNALRASGYTKIHYGSIGNWTKIITIQGSPLVSQELVDEVGEEVKRAFAPIVERYPERLKKALDHVGGTMNFILIYGSGGGWGAWYDGQGTIFAKRLSARDLDIFHEIGHHFDINNPSTSFRSHIDSILSAEDADAIDAHCSYIKDDGTCAYSEFIAENYGKMFYPASRDSVKTEFPVVYERLLKYVPTPSSYVPFSK